MSNVVVFKSNSHFSSERNCHEFINFCRDKLTVFGTDLKWESPVWKGVAIFRKLDGVKGAFQREYSLSNDYIDFSKSYIRYHQSLNPVKNVGGAMMALRCLEKALLQVCQNAFVYNTSVIVLDEAIQIASQYYKHNVLYKCAAELERLASFLSGHHLVKCGFLSWSNPVIPNIKNNYLPAIENIDRKNKLPDEHALFAIAEIFSRKDDELSNRDLFTTSVFALLMCSPSRISEILSLRADCEIVRKDKNGVERYGLRFYSAKGFGANIKWIPDVMIPVAKKAISRLLSLSANARSFARCFESGSDKFYRHELCPAVDEDEPLDVTQVCHALGYSLDDKMQCIQKLKRTSINGGVSFLNPTEGFYTLRSLWQMITDSFPADFPWFDKEKSVRYSNALCLLNLHQCHELKKTACHTLYKPTYDAFYQDIAKPKKSGKAMKNIFARYGYVDDSGEALYLRSHQPRHLLNTLAHHGELSEMDIAKWSGRVNVIQNRAYNHVSQEEMLEKMEVLKLGSNRYCNQDAIELVAAKNSNTFDEPEHGAIHSIANGYCIHNYVIPPCRELTETLDYGWAGYNENSQKQLEKSIIRIRSLYKLAQQAIYGGFYGADKWALHHEKVLSTLESKVIDNLHKSI